MQKMFWTEDGWLRLDGGGNLAKEYFEHSNLPEVKMPEIPNFDDFDSDILGIQYYAPRIAPESFADVKARPGYVRIRGQESRCSLNEVSILARKLTSVYATVTTKMEFTPEVHQHSAGLIMYYDNMNYIYLRKYYSETLKQSAISVIHLENGEKTEFLNTRIPVKECPIYFRLKIEGRKSYFEWSYDRNSYERIGGTFDTTKFSDEYCKYGEFTGTFIGITCADRVLHKHYADFDFFNYEADESKDVD
jgi:xylan 1,4-beta-xylosidase